MQKIKLNVGVVFTALVALSGIGLGMGYAQTQPAPPAKAAMHQGHHDKQGGEHKKMMDALNLTPEQKKQLKAAREQFKQAHASEITTLKAKREQLQQLGKDPANQKQREQLHAELKTAWENLRAEKKAAMQGILTPEQEAKMETMKQEFHKNHPAKKQGNAS